MTLFSNSIFVIAEMANSHEGNIEIAKKITAKAAESGANAIKFQKFTADELAEPNHKNYNLYKKLEMNLTEWKELIKFAKKKKLKIFVDVFGIKSAKSMLKLNVDGFKIHSSDITNPHILQFFEKIKKPILLSTAGCKLNEIDEALNVITKTPKEIVLMHGFQGYPTKIDDMNLKRINSLSEKYSLPVGLMDHVSGDSKMATILPLLGISMGATVIEKHITLDRSKKSLDYYSALNPSEFKELVVLSKMTKKALGTSDVIMKNNELTYRLDHKKNPIAKKFIKKGTKINQKFLDFKRTKTKKLVSFYELDEHFASRSITKGSVITKNMIKNKPKIVAVIACRVDSERLYAKPLQLIGKFKILELLINQIRKSSLIDEIVLAISENPGNEAFLDFAKKYKIKYVVGDDEDVLKRIIDAADYVKADQIFRVTSENPYIFWEGIDDLIKLHIRKKYDLSFYDKIPLGSFYEIIKKDALIISHKKGKKKHRSELVTLFINENKNKFKINLVKPEKKFQRPKIRLTVDSPQDLMVARIIHKNLGNGKNPIKLKKIIMFLDNNPDILKINQEIPIDVSRIWN